MTTLYLGTSQNHAVQKILLSFLIQLTEKTFKRMGFKEFRTIKRSDHKVHPSMIRYQKVRTFNKPFQLKNQDF